VNCCVTRALGCGAEIIYPARHHVRHRSRPPPNPRSTYASSLNALALSFGFGYGLPAEIQIGLDYGAFRVLAIRFFDYGPVGMTAFDDILKLEQVA
jgi:hypothetical protein